MIRIFFALIVLAAPCRAAVFTSAEPSEPGPWAWRGFLRELRDLRRAANPPSALDDQAVTWVRDGYARTVAALKNPGKATADQLADTTAALLRLGKPEKAIELIRPAIRRFPDDFRFAAHDAVAWLMLGKPAEAKSAFRDAAKLAPDAERNYLAFAAGWSGARAEGGPLDRVFGVDWTKSVTEEDAAKVTPEALAHLQRLSLSLPGDGKLLALLGVWAGAEGDVRTAANLLEGAVAEYGVTAREVRALQRHWSDKAADVALLPEADHDKYRGRIQMKSSRPFRRDLDEAGLTPLREKGTNELPWLLTRFARVGRPFIVDVPKRVAALDGRPVMMRGHLFPGADETVSDQFLLVENPIGCWFCDAPGALAVVKVVLPAGKLFRLKAGVWQVEGTLRLNLTEPEGYLYTLEGATVKEPD